MKIAYVTDVVYPYNLGGREKRLYDLSHALSKKGHKVEIYTSNFWGESKKIKQNKVILNGINKAYPLYTKGKRSIKQGIMFGISSLKLIKEKFDVIDADHIVYFHLFPLKIISLIKNKPLIVTWHEAWGKEYWQNYLGKTKGYIASLIEKLASRLPDKIIAVSEHTKQQLVKRLGVKKEKITVLPNSINLDLIKNTVESKEKSDIIFAGRLLAHKNVDLLLRAVQLLAKKHKDIKCIIIGDGPEKSNLEKLSKFLGIEKNIIFKGFLTNESKIYSLMKSSKVFALPSEREGFGIVVLEANAAGIPVVTVEHKNNAATNLIEEGKNGFIANLEQKSLASNIEKALKHYKNMKKQCIASSNKYDISQITDKIEKIYEK